MYDFDISIPLRIIMQLDQPRVKYNTQKKESKSPYEDVPKEVKDNALDLVKALNRGEVKMPEN